MNLTDQLTSALVLEACGGSIIQVSQHERVESLVFIVVSSVQEMVFTVWSLVLHLDLVTKHRTYYFVCLLNSDSLKLEM